MYNNQMLASMGEQVTNEQTFHRPPRRGVFLDGANFNPPATITQVAPAKITELPSAIKAFQDNDGNIYAYIKPTMVLLRMLGIFPVGMISKGIFAIVPGLIIYSIIIFLVMVAYIGYINWDTIEFKRSAEGRFEEAVIGYLFTVYLLPICLTPISWYESRKLARVFGDWMVFEKIYEKVEMRRLPLHMGNKPLMITLAIPLVSIISMVATHLTMVYFRFVQVIPYCYINTITYAIGGFWYMHCDLISKVAILIADDFQEALKHIGPASRVAEYRSLWMLLAKITRDVGLGSCYCVLLFCLYLFLIITLTIYGLLSTLQDGISIKDVGLTVTAFSSIGLLYFICDVAHTASNSVRVYFQKKLLLVELSWMNDDAQQEIQMFLRATEMNPTDMSLGGYFDVNRILFKSLLATMVTYLVVLLQFQISIPEDTMDLKLPNFTSAAVIAKQL